LVVKIPRRYVPLSTDGVEIAAAAAAAAAASIEGAIIEEARDGLLRTWYEVLQGGSPLRPTSASYLVRSFVSTAVGFSTA
jgi:hypothetical protein